MKLWIARDEDGCLYLHRFKPILITKKWCSQDKWQLYRKDFPDITFEKSPQEIELKIMLNSKII